MLAGAVKRGRCNRCVVLVPRAASWFSPMEAMALDEERTCSADAADTGGASSKQAHPGSRFRGVAR